MIMSQTVVKFGGSNLKSPQDVSRVVSVIKSYRKPLVIVVSAFYGVTEMLRKSLQEKNFNKEFIEKLIESLWRINKEIIFSNLESPGNLDLIIHELTIRTSALERYLVGVHYIGEIPEFVRDIVLSYGERLSSCILTAILKEQGIECEEVLPEQLELTTNGEFNGAVVNFETAEAGVRSRLKEGKTYIIPGFYGVSADGRITLFGKGGSDYSAAAIARCINAGSLDLWKDVSGFLSADPQMVPGAVPVKHLSYEEAAELSYFGSGILHPRTVEPLIEKHIPIHLYDIRDQAVPGVLTTINSVEHPSETIIKSITSTNDVSILRIKGVGVGIKPGILSKITSSFEKNKINIKSVLTTQTAINFILSRDDLHPASAVLGELDLEIGTVTETIDDISLVAIVGKGITTSYGIIHKISGAMARHRINLEFVSLGASGVAAYIIVKETYCSSVVRLIHKTFFSKPENKRKNKRVLTQAQARDPGPPRWDGELNR